MENEQVDDKPADIPNDKAATPEAAPEAKADNDDHDGKEFVKFSSPEEEARFKRIYGNMKQYERVVDQLTKDQKALIERLEKYENAKVQEKTDEEIAALKAEKREALSAGNFERVEEIDDELLERKLADKIKVKPEPKAAPKTPEEINAEYPWFTPERQNKYIAWARETTTDGELKRPWANPGHPLHQQVVENATYVINKPENINATDEEIMAQVDKLMGIDNPADRPGRRAVAGAVLSDDGNVRPKNKGSFVMTEDMKLIARKMGMTNEQYAKAHQKWSK